MHESVWENPGMREGYWQRSAVWVSIEQLSHAVCHAQMEVMQYDSYALRHAQLEVTVLGLHGPPSFTTQASNPWRIGIWMHAQPTQDSAAQRDTHLDDGGAVRVRRSLQEPEEAAVRVAGAVACRVVRERARTQSTLTSEWWQIALHGSNPLLEAQMASQGLSARHRQTLQPCLHY